MSNIKTENGQFIMFCVVNGDTMEYKATNMNETYAEKLKVSEVMNRVKELNKRIRFDEKTVCDTLTQRQPDDEIWLDEHDDSKGLKLRYMIRNCPFNFNFYLKKQAEEEHKVSLMVPLFKTISGLREQIVELKDAVTRKDVEIQQFKKEGAILKRTTVSTSTFNFDEFNKKYDECNKLAKVLEPVGLLYIEQLQNSTEMEAVSNTDVMVEENCESPKKNESPKKEQNKSPKNRKRTAMARKQKLLSRQLQSRKQNLDYESSQSFSQGSMDIQVETKESKSSTEMREDAIVTPRKKRKVTETKLPESDSDEISDELLNCKTPNIKMNGKKVAKRESTALKLSEDESSQFQSPVRKRIAPQVSSTTTSAEDTTDEDKQKDIENILRRLQELNKKRREELDRKMKYKDEK